MLLWSERKMKRKAGTDNGADHPGPRRQSQEQDDEEFDMFADEIIEIKPVKLTEMAPVVRSSGWSIRRYS